MSGRRSRQASGKSRRRPPALVDALLGVLAANLGVLAGWTQSIPLRVLVGSAFFAVTAAGLMVHLRLRPRVPSSLPSRGNIPFFRGRTRELAELEKRHQQERAKVDPAASGPILLAIHGRPGVGKTALAQQLALRIAGDYPDGVLDQNMGTAGGSKPPRDILHSLLLELHWPEEDMRGKSALELGGIFRAKTADKQMLIVLDAARSLQQLSEVLPGGNRCTVITTSRANLLAGRGQHSQRLEPVTGEEAGEILQAALGADQMTDPDLVAEAIELCDFQPNALLSFAHRASNEGIERAVERLRPENSRLDILRYGGRDVAERIASEYANLEEQERRAFLLLTIPESESFAPWALQPLLGIGSVEAGNLIASISKVGLLEHQGRDPSGFGRYRFSSLARLLAQQQLRNGDIPPAEVEQARQNFRRAYLAGTMKVIGHLGVTGFPSLPFHVPDYWYPQIKGWERQVADNIHSWVRAEFGSVVRVVQDAAANGQPVLCWQVAARLGDCYSPPVSHADVRLAFETALNAARTSSGAEAEISVHLAAGGYLTSVHEYSDAISELKAAADLATAPRHQAAAAEAFRRLGYAWQETGHYDLAHEALQHAHSASARARNCEARLIELLSTENRAISELGQWPRQPSVDSLRPDPRDSSQLLEKVILSRAARRRRDLAASEELLDAARQYCDGDVAHRAEVEYEQAVTQLHLATDRKAGSHVPPPEARSLVSAAAQAVRSSDRLNRSHAQAQTRCALAHAMILTGRAQACLRYLDAADHMLQLMPDADTDQLSARIHRLRGEALLRTDPQRALDALNLARQWLEPREPWAYAEVMVLAGIAHRQLHEFAAALAAHAAAVDIFIRNHDNVASSYALSEFYTTLRATGAGPLRARWVRHLIGRTP